MRIPLKARLTLMFSLAMAVVMVGLGTFVYLRVQADLLASVDAGLRSRAQVIANAVGAAQGQKAVFAEGKLIDPDEAFAQILDSSGRIIEASSAVADDPLFTVEEIGAIAAPTFVTRPFDVTRQGTAPDDAIRLLGVALQQPTHRIVIVGATLGDVTEAISRLFWVVVTAGPVAILLTAGAGWLLAGAMLRPVEQMRLEAAAVSSSDPARRLPVPRTGDELARLATTLNSMLDRLQESIERERRFIDNASHELRSPLATLRGEIELALTRKREAPELEASLRSAEEDVCRLQRLMEDLLVLARSRGGRIPVRRVRTPLSELVRTSVQLVESQAQEAGVRIDVEAADRPVEVDPERLRQALRNLLENAVRHSPRGGVVRLSAELDDEFVRLVVTDQGPGFPAEKLASVFNAFARDRTPGSESGGTGLGLAIVRAVAESHGGSATAENTQEGAKVTLDLRN